jgi:hypothetical protein
VEYLPGSGQACELYHLADPLELQNRADDKSLAQVKAGLAARLLLLKSE